MFPFDEGMDMELSGIWFWRMNIEFTVWGFGDLGGIVERRVGRCVGGERDDIVMIYWIASSFKTGSLHEVLLCLPLMNIGGIIIWAY